MTHAPSVTLVSSGVQWLAKLAIVIVSVWLAEHDTLTPQIAAVCTGALVSLGVTNAATLLASASRVLSILHAFAPGAAGDVATVLASIPPPPGPPPLPPPPPATPSTLQKAAAVSGGVWIAALLLFCFGLGCAASLLTPADQGATSQEMDQQIACVKNNRGNAPAIATCRDGVRKFWDRYWQLELFDGGKD